MFTTSCFIRKNTFAIRVELSKLGYENSSDNVVGDAIATSQVTSHYTTINQKMYDDFNPHSTWSNNRIDCGDNEELFFALAALRDDTDKYQWFIYNSMDCTVEKLRNFYWFKCEEDKIEDMMYWDCAFLNCTKATVEELIEYFK